MRKPHRKHEVIFPNLQQILDLLTVKAIMTPRGKFFCIHPKQDISEAEKLLSKQKFSGAPLEDEKIHRYVTLERLKKNLGLFKLCEQIAEEIGPNESVPENTTIARAIELFSLREDSSPFFVFHNKSVVGLVTAADLDKIPVKVYFFTLISALESLLLNIIGKGYHNKYKLLLDNPKQVEKRCRRCAGEKVGLEEHNYLMTREILEIVSKSDIRARIGVTDDSELPELQKFRNDVAHGNYIIIKDADVKKLKQKQEQICKYIRALMLSSSKR